MKPKTDGMTGPVVQKREVIMVAGLIASWIAVVYFLVNTSKNPADINSAPRAKVRVAHSELAPAVLERYSEEQPTPEIYDPEMFAPMDKYEVDGVFKSMKERSGERPGWFGSLITAEDAPAPVTVGESSLMEEIIHRDERPTIAPDEALEQEGEYLEAEPPETPVTDPAIGETTPAAEPIKS